MTVLKMVVCPHGPGSSRNFFNGKLKLSFKPKHATSSVVGFSTTQGPMRKCHKLPNSVGIGQSKCIGGHERLINLGIESRSQIVKMEPRYCTYWSRKSIRSDMFTTPPDNNSWFGKLMKLCKPLGEGEGDSQKTAVLDVRIKFSLSNPKSVADSLHMFGPRWFKLLKGAQSLLNPPLQNGGGGNKDGDLYNRFRYGGDDDSDKNRGSRQSKNNLLICQWWALSVALMSILVWALRTYSGIPQRNRLSFPQFVDCMLWLGLMWCVAAFFLWTGRIIVSLIPVSEGYSNGWNLFKSKNALSVTREFVVNSKLDEWMAHNVVSVPGLTISLFLASDLTYYAKNIDFTSGVSSGMSRISQLFKFRVGNASRVSPLFSREVSTEKKRRQGTSSFSKRQKP